MAVLLGNARLRRWATLIAAVVLLDASLTFRNIWPTPAIRWRGELSVELAVCILALAIANRWAQSVTRAALGWMAVLWVALVIGQYAAVTAPALYGRDINLYWDVRHVSAVAAMLTRVAAWWLVILVTVAAISIPVLLFLIIRWALWHVRAAMDRTDQRRVLLGAAVTVAVLFAGRELDEHLAAWLPVPVTSTYLRQARLLAGELTGYRRRTLPPALVMDSDLTNVAGADVLLIFIESYGAVSFDKPAFADRLAADRQQFDTAIHASGRDVVSAYVESPTFGGSSWLAHVSLLSGVEVRDEDTDVLLMSQKRDTLVTTFARHGYRTVAIMPGLQQSWPEGSYYGFTEIYGEARLDYRGPPFGWWSIPDQFAIARMDALVVNQPARAPAFVFFPTTSTHTPFSPTPPYQADWGRLLTENPYDERDLNRAWDEVPDWMDLGPSYVHSLSYAYASIGGYLRTRADRDFVMILIGDHQPPAAVTGEGASWEVPVHVIASRPGVLERLRAHGFRRGVTPQHPSISRMHALVPVLLDAFGAQRDRPDERGDALGGEHGERAGGMGRGRYPEAVAVRLARVFTSGTMRAPAHRLLPVALCLFALASVRANDYDTARTAAVSKCEAINPSEHQSGLLFNPDGYRSYYVRSECLQRTAVQFRDDTLCARVRQRRSLFSSSWGCPPARISDRAKRQRS
jgi:hypothetical protein